ncbi:hypothetical protein LTR08_003346 [Meristemomyces frigidus]|nr:hypothetical protein LTR08_003346 [Meristemomyces frigidus]
MAAVRKGGHKGLMAPRLEAEKENPPPPKDNKRTQSIAGLGLFEGARKVRRKLDEENDAVVAKATHAGDPGDDFLTRFSSKKKRAENNPAYLAYCDAAKAYQEGALATGATELKPVYEELVRRINKLDIHGMPMEVPGVPSDAEVDALDAENRALSRPIGEESIEIEVRSADGSLTRKHVTLDESLKAFLNHIGKKRGDLKKIERKLREIEEEIAIAKEDALGDEDGLLKRAANELDAEVAAIHEKMAIYRAETAADVKRMHKEDKAAGTEVNRKIKDFLKALQ